MENAKRKVLRLIDEKYHDIYLIRGQLIFIHVSGSKILF